MTTERTNLAAYTEAAAPAGQYVGYISINRETTGAITVTVRERGDGTKQATIALPPEALQDLAIDLAHLGGDDFTKALAGLLQAAEAKLCRPWHTYEDAMRDPVFQQARGIMGTENYGQDDSLRRAILHVLTTPPVA